MTPLVLVLATLLAPPTLLNVSFDPTRELYAEVDAAFVAAWKARTGADVRVMQSHGGSGRQARAVLEGLEADVVTLALGYDIDVLAQRGALVKPGWRSRLPFDSCPSSSVVVFLVRRGNPKGIHDWGDLARPGVSVIVPNPKTSGGARYSYLAAWAWALSVEGNDSERATRRMSALLRNVPVLDTGARGSTMTFTRRGLGDVLLAWESEALLAMRELPGDGLELVRPATTIVAELPVAVVDAVVDARGTRALAEAYAAFLFTPQVQELFAKHGFRPRVPEVAARFAARFPPVTAVSVAQLGGWDTLQKRHFEDGGLFDRIWRERQ